MELLSNTSIEVREVTYIVQHPTEGIFYCKEWLNSSGNVIDSLIRTKHGYEVDDPKLSDEIWDFINAPE